MSNDRDRHVLHVNKIIREATVGELSRQANLSRYGALKINCLDKSEEGQHLISIHGTVGLDALASAIARSSPTHVVVDEVLRHAESEISEMADRIREYVRQAFAKEVRALHVRIESSDHAIAKLKGKLKEKNTRAKARRTSAKKKTRKARK